MTCRTAYRFLKTTGNTPQKRQPEKDSLTHLPDSHTLKKAQQRKSATSRARSQGKMELTYLTSVPKILTLRIVHVSPPSHPAFVRFHRRRHFLTSSMRHPNRISLSLPKKLHDGEMFFCKEKGLREARPIFRHLNSDGGYGFGGIKYVVSPKSKYEVQRSSAGGGCVALLIWT